MPYIIKKTNGAVLLTLNDFTSDNTSTSLVLAGRGVPNYGMEYVDNFVRLCENFSNGVPPISPMSGQVWFNSYDNVLCVQYTGTANDAVYPTDMATLSSWHPLATRDWVSSFTESQVNGISITLTGDVNGSGNFIIPTTLANVNPNIGNFNNVTVNSKGLVTNAASLNYALESFVETAIQSLSNTIASVDAVLQAQINTIVPGIIPIGGIILWSGAVAAIPEHWALCNGQNGTPNLQDRFIVGAGNSYSVGVFGGSSALSMTTGSAGTHNHGGSDGATTLTSDQMPTHTHTGTVTATDSGHSHSITMSANAFGNTFYIGCAGSEVGEGTAIKPTGTSNANISTSLSINNTGGGNWHNHTISSDGAHTHTVSVSNSLPPYYALAYIQRIS